MARMTRHPPSSGRYYLATSARIYRCQNSVGTRDLWQSCTHSHTHECNGRLGNNEARPTWRVGLRDHDDFVPGGRRHCAEFWGKVLLRDHPERTMLLPCMTDMVSVDDFFYTMFAAPRHRKRPCLAPFPAKYVRIGSSQGMLALSHLQLTRCEPGDGPERRGEDPAGTSATSFGSSAQR